MSSDAKLGCADGVSTGGSTSASTAATRRGCGQCGAHADAAPDAVASFTTPHARDEIRRRAWCALRVGIVEQRECTRVVDPPQQTGQGAQFGDRGTAVRTVVEMLFELAALGGREGAQHVGRVPLGEARVIGVLHRVTPFSCRASRSARRP